MYCKLDVKSSYHIFQNQQKDKQIGKISIKVTIVFHLTINCLCLLHVFPGKCII